MIWGGVSHALTAKHSATGRYDPNGETWVAHTLQGGGFDLCGGDGQVAPSLQTGGGKAGRGYPAVAEEWAVRRLTPVECERLQGFPDGYTAVEYRGKIAADGPRYKALGNSMAVNVMRWIGQRIELCDSL